jgi:hypothetical protein
MFWACVFVLAVALLVTYNTTVWWVPAVIGLVWGLGCLAKGSSR